MINSFSILQNLIEKPEIIENDLDIKRKPDFDEELFRRMKEELLKKEQESREEELKKAQKKHDIALTNINKLEDAFY